MFSFVIPVLNEAGSLPGLLAELRRNFPAAQSIVVDGGSRDDSVAIALRDADVVLTSEPGRAQQMNLGASVANGDWLLFLHADTRPLFDETQLLDALQATQQWGFCKVTLEGRPRALRLVSWCMNQRSRLTGIATGDQLMIVRRDLFSESHGFREQPLMEDIELSGRLRRRSSPYQLPLLVSSSGRRWEKQGVVSTILRMWLLRAAYWCGVSPQRLWHHYYGERALTSSIEVRKPGTEPHGH